MLRLGKIIKPWRESAALNDHINLYGFWNETTFLTKSGDVGMVLSISGVDYESLDRSEQEYAVKRLEAALKAFGPGFHVYQYLFKTCVVGTMMLQVLPPDNSFGDLAKFLIGWLLLPAPSGNPGDYDNQPITLGTVLDFQTQMKDSDFWKGFPDAALVVTKNQFVPTLKTLQQNQDEPLAVIPPWPGSSFSYVPGGAPPVTGKPLKVMEGNSPMDGDNAAFVEYCHHLIVGALSEIGLFIQSAPGESRYDRAKSMKWSEIWNQMFAQL